MYNVIYSPLYIMPLTGVKLMFFQNTRNFLVIFASLTLITACDKLPIGNTSSSNCSSAEAQVLLKDIINETAEKSIKNSDLPIDLSKARATLAELKISADNIRTTKKDPNSSKQFCTGTIKIVIPTEMFSNIEKSWELSGKTTKFSEAVENDGFKTAANVLAKDFDYSIQPTDDNKKLFVELEQAKPLSELVRSIVTLDLMKSKIEAKVAEENAKITAQQEADIARIKADYDKVKRENTEARKTINERWNSLEKDVQNEYLADQKAWVAQKKAQCGEINKNAAIDFKDQEATSKEIAKLTCDTNFTLDRINSFF